MPHTPFTARNAAKYAVKAAIAIKTARAAENVITDYSRFEKDDTIVNIGTGMVGWFVSDKLKPVTDKMVDKTFDFVAAKREARKAKKNKTNE